ncbi:MAG: hypothetical protein V4574_10170 [Pseudomonadota bacterium]
MRRALLIIAAVAFAAIGVVVHPYEAESVTARVIANPTGCTVDVQNYSGWKPAHAALGLPAERVADPLDAYAFVYGCPGVPDGRPASLALTSEGKAYPSESCGVGLKTDYGCRVRIPAAPRAYRLRVQPGAQDKPQWIEIEVRRTREWRSGGFDALMSV